jgi:hypothetical protein
MGIRKESRMMGNNGNVGKFDRENVWYRALLETGKWIIRSVDIAW